MRFMPIVAKMAFRNVFKYGRRSIETFIVVFMGVAAVALVDSFLNGFSDRIVAGFAVADGHVRVSAPGYEARRSICPLDKLVADPEAVASSAEAAAREAAPPGAGATPFAEVAALATLRAPCVLQFGDASVNAVATGAEAFMERDGLAPPFRSAPLAEGRYPDPGERGMVLSAREAGRLGAALGDSVIVLASDAYGSFGAVELELLGIARANPGPDSCLIGLGAMRELLGVESGAVQVALYLVDPSGSPIDPRLAPEAVGAMAGAAEAAGLEAVAWDSSGNPASALVAFFDSFMYAMYAIFVIVAASGIANSVLLSVQDRTRDFATLRAVAFSSGWVNAIVVLETLFVGAAASLSAVLASALVVAAMGPEGIHLSRAVRGIAEFMPEYIPARIELPAMALIFLGGSLAPLAAAAYPLAVLRKMNIREALGYV